MKKINENNDLRKYLKSLQGLIEQIENSIDSGILSEENLPTFILNYSAESQIDFSNIFTNLNDFYLYKENLVENKKSKERIVVTYQGISGAYSHLTAKKFFPDDFFDVKFIGLPTFQNVLDSIENEEADYAVLPIENTTAGSINESYDLLSNYKLYIIGEETYQIDHCLLAIDEIPLNKIRKVFSHPQAIAQCSIFLSTLNNCKIESYFDTAMAIRKVYEDEEITQAAIGSSEAASLYKLKILKKDISNSKDNLTRFFIISKTPKEFDSDIQCKTSIILATKHHEGALVKALNILADNHLNLTKIQSRPRPNNVWEYLFYIDFEGNISSENVKKALTDLTKEASFIKILGSYPIKAIPTSFQKKVVSETQNLGDFNEPIVLPRESDSHKPYKLASRDHNNQNTVIKVKNVLIGDGNFIVMAGPCAVESEEQINSCAKIVSECGAHILRGGVFKPRTSPYSFQGLGLEGLDLLCKAGQTYGLPVITEILDAKDLKNLAMVADIIQIGARNMQNFSLLSEVGAINKPILLKRGMMSSIDELLSAAEYILKQGNQQVILCERGIRTFENATRNTLDLSAIPILKYYSHLPVIVDPSHAVGDWRFVIPLVEASVAVGADGVIVEIHPEPDKALSDGKQSLNFNKFKYMINRINKIKDNHKKDQ